MNNNSCAIIGDYPKSYIKSDLAKILHDNIIRMYGNCSNVNRIRNFYDLIFSLQIQIENNKLSDYNKKMINSFKTIDNLLGYYFNNIRKLMMDIKMRDDMVLENDHIHNHHLKMIKFFIEKNNIEL